MKPMERIMTKLLTTKGENTCQWCGKIIQVGEVYCKFGTGRTNRCCQDCYRKIFLEVDDEDEEAFGMTFYLLDPRTGDTIEVFT